MVALLAACLWSCSPPPPSDPVARGRWIYVANCISCHNPNPNLPGLIGPPIAGSSTELIRDRVLHLAYPPGYHPKRTTHEMRAFPRLTPEIPYLAAYLAAAKTHHPAGGVSRAKAAPARKNAPPASITLTTRGN